MEDGNYANVKDDRSLPTSLSNVYGERVAQFAANGHNPEADGSFDEYYSRPLETAPEDKARKRINPLKIHLGKNPFVDNSPPCHNSSNKKKKAFPRRPSDKSAFSPVPRVPKLIPKRNHVPELYHNVPPQIPIDVLESEKDKPVPRLVPKSQLHQYKKSTLEKKTQLKDAAPNSGPPSMVTFKCRKCCAISFTTLAKLKEHQLVCRIQPKEPTPSPESAPPTDDNMGGPSRVTKKVYLCSACGTYYENWNLFLHMREVHNRHICLFCLGMFSKADKLSAHIVHKHNVQEHSYTSNEDFCSVYNGSLYLMCCDCDEIFSEKDNFYNHECKVIPKPVLIPVSKNTGRVMKQGKICDTGTGPPPAPRDDKMCHISKTERDVLLDSASIATKQETSEQFPMAQNFSAGSTNLIQHYNNTIKEFQKATQTLGDKSTAEYYETKRQATKVLTNGDDIEEELRDKDDSLVPMDVDPPATLPLVLLERPQPPPPPPSTSEKEGGIKLKLSLNNAKSPVIINSTVDPSIGRRRLQKQSRSRRPPKRYDKALSSESPQPLQPQLRTPSIKMTIYDKADSPFVKTTFYENNQETTLRTLLNNNLESSPKTLQKSESMVMSTIYDNNLEDTNTLNRVPKLTVRVPKELLDKDSSSDSSSDSENSGKLTVDETTSNNEVDTEVPVTNTLEPAETTFPQQSMDVEPPQQSEEVENQPVEDVTQPTSTVEDPKPEPMDTDNVDIEKITEEPLTERIPVIELRFNRPLDKYPLKELLKLFLSSTVYNCIYCNHVRKIAVNCEQLALHIAEEHRFSATVDSITAEELMPETITQKVKSDAELLRTVYINYDSYDSEEPCENNYDYLFECFQCYFKTSVHKDLYLHNRKMHQKTILLCVMCKSNFYSYSELLCHLCPGTYDSECEIKFRCHLCNVDNIPSSFRLMVHLRKIHNSCDVCLEFCHNQARLSNHVWKHKLHHFCYRCGIAYRNKPDITNHLFWKHGTQSVICKKCMQKKWPHVYHFCTPPAIFVCEECNLQFSKAVYLKVHKRFHTEEYPHACIEEGCTDKFVSKKLLMKHLEEHQRKLASEDLDGKKEKKDDKALSTDKEAIPVIDLVNDENEDKIEKTNKSKTDTNKVGEPTETPKKSKKKKLKDKDALLLDVNLPELNLSESDSSDESETEQPKTAAGATLEEGKKDAAKEENQEIKEVIEMTELNENAEGMPNPVKTENTESTEAVENPDEKKVLEIWNNLQKFQEKIEPKTDKTREKTPPLVPIRKHVCESDHDYCLIPTDLNGDDLDKKKKKKDRLGDGSSSSSSSSSDSDSSCSCGSNCSCSSSSGSSSSSSDSDSSDEPNKVKKKKQRSKTLSSRRLSNGSNVDVMGMSETPILIPEKAEPLIAETDLDTQESETDEEFYDRNPQSVANKLFAEKRNQLLLLASVAPSEGGSTGEPSRPTTPVQAKEEKKPKTPGSKKKSKKKKRSKGSRKHGPIKLNIPKDVLQKPKLSDGIPPTPLAPNKITISLQSNTVQVPEHPAPAPAPVLPQNPSTPALPGTAENKRASKRRRVPNKFYGYSSDEEPSTPQAAFKPYQPPKLEWRKEDLPSPVSHRAKKETPTTTLPNKLFNYVEPIRLKAPPMPDPEPPRILMNTESMGSSDSDSSEEGALEIYQPGPVHNAIPVPPPAYLNSGTSSLPYAFQRPAGRQAREGESVYCYCRCPYDEVSEMIACDADGCAIEWFHFECVGIMVPPKGKWYCPECRKKQLNLK